MNWIKKWVNQSTIKIDPQNINQNFVDVVYRNV